MNRCHLHYFHINTQMTKMLQASIIFLECIICTISDTTWNGWIMYKVIHLTGAHSDTEITLSNPQVH